MLICVCLCGTDDLGELGSYKAALEYHLQLHQVKYLIQPLSPPPPPKEMLTLVKPSADEG